MATKVSELTDVTTPLNGTEQLLISQGGQSKKATLTDIHTREWGQYLLTADVTSLPSQYSLLSFTQNQGNLTMSSSKITLKGGHVYFVTLEMNTVYFTAAGGSLNLNVGPDDAADTNYGLRVYAKPLTHTSSRNYTFSTNGFINEGSDVTVGVKYMASSSFEKLFAENVKLCVFQVY